MHAFHQSIGNPNLCGVCKRPSIDHGAEATCETCPNVGKMEIHDTMLMCPDCITRERASYAERMSASAVATRVNEMNATLAKAHELESKIATRSDIFNAETLSIVEMKAAIDNDANIINKHITLGMEVANRLAKNQQLIFEANQTIADAVTRQKAEQVYLNNLANLLTAAEREKLKIADINYQPSGVKPPKPAKIGVKKIDKNEVKAAAKKYDLPEYMIQTVCIQKLISPEDAAAQIRKSIDDNKATS